MILLFCTHASANQSRDNQEDLSSKQECSAGLDREARTHARYRDPDIYFPRGDAARKSLVQNKCLFSRKPPLSSSTGGVGPHSD